MQFYIESADRPYKSGLAAEDIEFGSAVHYDGEQMHLLDATASHDFAGVAVADRTEDELIDHPLSDAADEIVSSDDRVASGGDADKDRIKLKTISDDTLTAPSISAGDVVGVAGVEDGRIVEEGYSDSGTTYGSGSTGDFYRIGRALRDDSTDYDSVVRVEVNE